MFMAQAQALIAANPGKVRPSRTVALSRGTKIHEKRLITG